MNKISFQSSKKTKFRKFEDNVNQKTEIQKVPKSADKAEIKPVPQKEKIYINKNEIFTDLSNTLINRYNIDDISVYTVSTENKDILSFKKLYGLEISKYVLEKYFGYDCPVICTNAGGMADNSSHRARFIEKINSYLIVISSSAYEVYRDKYNLNDIRQIIMNAFTEVEKFK